MTVSSTGISPKQAGELVGRTKAAIIKAIREGRISGEKDANGEWRIEPAELLRVYQPANDGTPQEAPRVDAGLQAEIEGLRRLVALLENQRDDLRQRLDRESEERRALTLMLATEIKATRKTVWQRLTGRD